MLEGRSPENCENFRVEEVGGEEIGLGETRLERQAQGRSKQELDGDGGIDNQPHSRRSRSSRSSRRRSVIGTPSSTVLRVSSRARKDS